MCGFSPLVSLALFRKAGPSRLRDPALYLRTSLSTERKINSSSGFGPMRILRKTNCFKRAMFLIVVMFSGRLRASQSAGLPLGYPATTTVATYANPKAGDRVDFACTPSGFRAHADGQYFAGHAPERPGWDRGLLAGANWCGRSRLLGRYRDWFATLWKVDPERRSHSNLPGSWSDADHTGRRRGARPGGWGGCHVGFPPARLGIYADCDADSHGRFWRVSADTPGSSARDA